MIIKKQTATLNVEGRFLTIDIQDSSEKRLTFLFERKGLIDNEEEFTLNYIDSLTIKSIGRNCYSIVAEYTTADVTVTMDGELEVSQFPAEYKCEAAIVKVERISTLIVFPFWGE